jgi:hypothetical protein
MFVAVPPGRDENPVRVFATFTEDLERLTDWLEQCGVTTVALESTGVYWIPIFEILEQRGIRPFGQCPPHEERTRTAHRLARVPMVTVPALPGGSDGFCCLHRRTDCYRVERSSSRAGISSRCGPALFSAHCYRLVTSTVCFALTVRFPAKIIRTTKPPHTCCFATPVRQGATHSCAVDSNAVPNP